MLNHWKELFQDSIRKIEGREDEEEMNIMRREVTTEFMAIQETLQSMQRTTYR